MSVWSSRVEPDLVNNCHIGPPTDLPNFFTTQLVEKGFVLVKTIKTNMNITKSSDFRDCHVTSETFGLKIE